MLQNMPDRVDFEDLKLSLDATSEGHYDFLYLRIDFSNNLKVVETLPKSTADIHNQLSSGLLYLCLCEYNYLFYAVILARSGS
jgi:hypothetical protein